MTTEIVTAPEVSLEDLRQENAALLAENIRLKVIVGTLSKARSEDEYMVMRDCAVHAQEMLKQCQSDLACSRELADSFSYDDDLRKEIRKLKAIGVK